MGLFKLFKDAKPSNVPYGFIEVNYNEPMLKGVVVALRLRDISAVLPADAMNVGCVILMIDGTKIPVAQSYRNTLKLIGG